MLRPLCVLALLATAYGQGDSGDLEHILSILQKPNGTSPSTDEKVATASTTPPFVEDKNPTSVPSVTLVPANPIPPFVEDKNQTLVPSTTLVPANPISPFVEDKNQTLVPSATLVPANPIPPFVEDKNQTFVPSVTLVPANPIPPFVEDKNQTPVPSTTLVPANPISPFVEDKNQTLVPSATLVPGVMTPSGDLSCMTKNNEPGECVKYYLCSLNNVITVDGTSLIDIRGNGGACDSYLDTCCLVADQRPPDEPITPKPPTKDEVREGCGWRNPYGVAFRVTGDTNEESKFGEFPWVVAILKIEPVSATDPDTQLLNVYVGGGSLIHPSVVLTTAHYVVKANKLRVRAGEWDTQTTKEFYPYQDRDVTSLEVHKDFNGGNLFYDIALLFLNKPMDLAPNVGLACLPQPHEKTQPGTRCYATGWGKDKFGKEGRYQVILKKVELPVVSTKSCQNLLRKTRLGRLFELHHTFMCAGGEPGKDTCKGDGGSPLVCPMEFQNNRYVQSGMVAWGIGCGEDGTPGVYVDVAKLRDWIDDKITGKGFQPDVYSKY